MEKRNKKTGSGCIWRFMEILVWRHSCCCKKCKFAAHTIVSCLLTLYLLWVPLPAAQPPTATARSPNSRNCWGQLSQLCPLPDSAHSQATHWWDSVVEQQKLPWVSVSTAKQYQHCSGHKSKTQRHTRYYEENSTLSQPKPVQYRTSTVIIQEISNT